MTGVTIALSASGLALTFPSDTCGRTHTIEVPLNIGGLKIIQKALRARAVEYDRRIGNPASPTQYMVEEWLAAERKALVAKPLLIEGLDLSGIDLDL